LTGWGAIRARQTLAGALQPSDGDTIVMDDGGSGEITYRFKSATVQAFDVKIGGDVATTHANLLAAVNASGVGDGTDYHAGTTVHTTMIGISAGSTSSIYAARNGGTAGNSIAVTDVSVNWSWIGGTLSGGAADGATMGNVDIAEKYPGDIHTTGTKADLNCGRLIHQGTGSLYFDIVNVTRFVVVSNNYTLAADLIMTSSLTALEITKGRVKLHAGAGTALPDKIVVSDLSGNSENLRLTGATTLTGIQLIVSPGIVSVNGPDWTSIENYSGQLTIEDGAVATLRSTGLTVLKSTDTMTIAYILGGDFDLTEGAGGKTVTSIWLAPQARFHTRGEDFDTFTLFEIGV
jgi:hypothetical protein